MKSNKCSTQYYQRRLGQECARVLALAKLVRAAREILRSTNPKDWTLYNKMEPRRK